MFDSPTMELQLFAGRLGRDDERRSAAEDDFGEWQGDGELIPAVGAPSTAESDPDGEDGESDAGGQLDDAGLQRAPRASRAVGRNHQMRRFAETVHLEERFGASLFRRTADDADAQAIAHLGDDFAIRVLADEDVRRDFAKQQSGKQRFVPQDIDKTSFARIGRLRSIFSRVDIGAKAGEPGTQGPGGEPARDADQAGIAQFVGHGGVTGWRFESRDSRRSDARGFPSGVEVWQKEPKRGKISSPGCDGCRTIDRSVESVMTADPEKSNGRRKRLALLLPPLVFVDKLRAHLGFRRTAEAADRAKSFHFAYPAQLEMGIVASKIVGGPIPATLNNERCVMRGAVLALLFGSSLALVCGMAFDGSGRAFGQRPAAPALATAPVTTRTAQAADLIAMTSDAGAGAQQLILVDARSRVIGVYHVDRATGQVVLKSVRNVQGDLQMDEFNSGGPTPQEIRSLLPPR